MKKRLIGSFKIILVFFIIFLSCKSDKSNSFIENDEELNTVFNDSSYILNSAFPFGDARRYGVTAETAKLGHPFTGKNRMTTVLDLAEKEGIEMKFPPGYYGMDLTLDSRSDMNLIFNNSEFSLIHITQANDTLPKPRRIKIKGTVIAYDRLGITEALDIEIDSIIIKSDTLKNLTRRRSRGCHIYHGCNDIKIKYLQVDDLGSDPVKDKYTHAALAMDGWQNNPVNVHIDEINIKSTDRHGIYMTGSDHFIGDIVIDRFGIGSSEGMDGMQDAKKGEEKEFKALWINKCYNSFIENIVINEEGSKGKYTAHFDAGNNTKPVTIGYFEIKNDNPKIEILKEKDNAVVIETMN